MHDSMQRLLTFARDATRGKAGQVLDFKALQRVLNESSATMTNWKSRGVSKEGALKAERHFGCKASWILDGEGSPGKAKVPDEFQEALNLSLLPPDQLHALLVKHIKTVENLASALRDAASTPVAGVENAKLSTDGAGLLLRHRRKIERDEQSSSTEKQPEKKRRGR